MFICVYIQKERVFIKYDTYSFIPVLCALNICMYL